MVAIRSIQERLLLLIDKFSGGNRADFGRKINIPSGTLQNYADGGRVPDHKYLISIRENLRVSIDWLLTGEGAMCVGGGAGEGEFSQKRIDEKHPASDNKSSKNSYTDQEMKVMENDLIDALKQEIALLKENASLRERVAQLEKNNPGESSANQMAS